MRIMSSIEKFFYFSLNYVQEFYKWKSIWGEEESGYLPVFIMDIDWTCGKNHMIAKWKAVEEKDCWGVINRFYAELDSNNRALLEEYVIKGGK